MRRMIGLAALLLACGVASADEENAAALGYVRGAALRWEHLSSKAGDLPVPGESTQQTGAIVADLDQDGLNDFVLSFRQKAPALVWYRRTGKGWDRYVIEKE